MKTREGEERRGRGRGGEEKEEGRRRKEEGRREEEGRRRGRGGQARGGGGETHPVRLHAHFCPPFSHGLTAHAPT